MYIRELVCMYIVSANACVYEPDMMFPMFEFKWDFICRRGCVSPISFKKYGYVRGVNCEFEPK